MTPTASAVFACHGVSRLRARYAIQARSKGWTESSVALVINATPHRKPYAHQSRTRREPATLSVAHRIVAASRPDSEVSQIHWNGTIIAFGKTAQSHAAPAPTASPPIRLPA